MTIANEGQQIGWLQNDNNNNNLKTQKFKKNMDVSSCILDLIKVRPVWPIKSHPVLSTNRMKTLLSIQIVT